MQTAPLVDRFRMDTEEASRPGLPLLENAASHGAAAFLLRHRQVNGALRRHPCKTYALGAVCFAATLLVTLGLCRGHSELQRQIAELQRYSDHYSTGTTAPAPPPLCPPALHGSARRPPPAASPCLPGSLGCCWIAAEAYILGALSTADCPEGTYYLGSEASCHAAGAALGLAWGSAVDLATVPRWCTATTTHVYFNSHHTGARFASAKPVCSTSGTAAPTGDGDTSAPMSGTAMPTGFGDTFAPKTFAPNVADPWGTANPNALWHSPSCTPCDLV